MNYYDTDLNAMYVDPIYPSIFVSVSIHSQEEAVIDGYKLHQVILLYNNIFDGFILNNRSEVDWDINHVNKVWHNNLKNICLYKIKKNTYRVRVCPDDYF